MSFAGSPSPLGNWGDYSTQFLIYKGFRLGTLLDFIKNEHLND
jgi:hypothetical protein